MKVGRRLSSRVTNLFKPRAKEDVSTPAKVDENPPKIDEPTPVEPLENPVATSEPAKPEAETAASEEPKPLDTTPAAPVVAAAA